MLPELKPIAYDEFMKMDSKTEERLEYINGQIYSHASPSIDHQRTLGRLFRKLSDFFDGKACEPFISPIDILLQNKKEKHKVQPDIAVICDKSGLNTNNYVGVPSLIIEVLSPSTASRDFIEKMNIYLRFGVKEYWIVSPRNKGIQVFVLEENFYLEPINYKENDILQSILFTDLKINLEEIFF